MALCFQSRQACIAWPLSLFERKVSVVKNPFMSMFLSSANKIAGSARAQATAAVKREAAKNTREMTQAWTDALLPKAAPARKRKVAKK